MISITRIGVLALLGCLAWAGWASLRPQVGWHGQTGLSVLAPAQTRSNKFERATPVQGALSTRAEDGRQAESSPGSSLGATRPENARACSWSQRLLGWLLAVLLLPVFTISFMRAMFRRNSNGSNAFVLAVYTLADALLAWLLVGGALSSWWTVALFVLAVGAALAYNIRIMTFVVTLEA